MREVKATLHVMYTKLLTPAPPLSLSLVSALFVPGLLQPPKCRLERFGAPAHTSAAGHSPSLGAHQEQTRGRQHEGGIPVGWLRCVGP